MSNVFLSTMLIASLIASIIVFVFLFVSLVGFLFSIKSSQVKNDLKTNLTMYVSPVLLLFSKELNAEQEKLASEVKFRFLLAVAFLVAFAVSLKFS